jgi:Flp pilus assembly protein TadD
MSFVPGAIAGSFTGTGARTFRAPPETWVPTGDANRTTWYAGSPESLIGDLIRDGVTGVAGYVAEPFLNGTVRPQILFPAYVAGFNLIEAYYLAIPHLGWQTIVIGDPLCAPFPRKALAPSDIDDGLDEVAQMPALFSKRRMEIEKARFPNTPERAVALVMRSTTMAMRGDTEATRASLEEALKLDPRYVPALLLMSSLDEQAQRYDQAMARYQQILEVQPNHAIALNNLAMTLAVHRNMPMEALVFARRAVAQAPGNIPILETLGWIQHLLGDDASAVKVMAEVARANLPVASIRLHTAIVFASQGVKAVAQNELAIALRLNPELEKTEEVKQLRAKLGPAPAAPRPAAPGAPPARQ